MNDDFMNYEVMNDLTWTISFRQIHFHPGTFYPRKNELYQFYPDSKICRKYVENNILFSKNAFLTSKFKKIKTISKWLTEQQEKSEKSSYLLWMITQLRNHKNCGTLSNFCEKRFTLNLSFSKMKVCGFYFFQKWDLNNKLNFFYNKLCWLDIVQDPFQVVADFRVNSDRIFKIAAYSGSKRNDAILHHFWLLADSSDKRNWRTRIAFARINSIWRVKRKNFAITEGRTRSTNLFHQHRIVHRSV